VKRSKRQGRDDAEEEVFLDCCVDPQYLKDTRTSGPFYRQSQKQKRNVQGELLIRIGVTGHRVLTDVEKIEAGVAQALQRIELEFPGESLTVISALAEGADRIVARAVLERPGARLIAPLPLSKSDYITDFKSPESRAEFLSLLDRAEDVIEVKPVTSRDEAYEIVGDYVIQHSDVLVAIWDGRDPQGRGGTGAIVERARARRLPTAWVHAGNRDPESHEPMSLGVKQGLVSFERFKHS